MSFVADQALANNRIPPTGQRNGGETTPLQKDALLAHGATTTWAAELPWVLLGLRSTPRDDTNISPAQPLYGTPLVLPNQYLSINNEQTKNEFIIQIDKIFL